MAICSTSAAEMACSTKGREAGAHVTPEIIDAFVRDLQMEAGDRVGIASGLLQHIDRGTTEKHYNRGATIGAVRRYQQILDQLMGE